MDLFPDGQHVWLRSSGRGGKYLHADEDGVGVCVSSKRASLLSAWKVHRAVGPTGEMYVLLYGAAYGRYLTASRDPAPHGHKGRLVIQGPYNVFEAVAWMPVRVGAGDRGDTVLLRHYSGHVLRSNGEIFFWNKGVSAEATATPSAMSHWVVRAIPPGPFPPQLPAPIPDPACFCIGSKRCMCTVVPGEPGRLIRFMRADDNGIPDANAAWNELRFDGRSVFNLREALAGALEEADALGIKVCARAGDLARLTPLAVDLPRHHTAMDIIVLTEGSPAAEALQYPDIDVQ